jgi:hypothetical protein
MKDVVSFTMISFNTIITDQVGCLKERTMKSNDITKYDLDWQIARVKQKDHKTIEDKLEAITEYFFAHLNKADRERVLNYLVGLSMAYKGEDRLTILQVKDELAQIPVSNENRYSVDLDKYSDDEIDRLAKDLFVRTKKWLDKGYDNREINEFLLLLYSHIDAEDKIEKLQALRKVAAGKENTHKFFF